MKTDDDSYFAPQRNRHSVCSAIAVRIRRADIMNARQTLPPNQIERGEDNIRLFVVSYCTTAIRGNVNCAWRVPAIGVCARAHAAAYCRRTSERTRAEFVFANPNTINDLLVYVVLHVTPLDGRLTIITTNVYVKCVHAFHRPGKSVVTSCNRPCRFQSDFRRRILRILISSHGDVSIVKIGRTNDELFRPDTRSLDV